jgi:translation initiation factor IF-3
LQYRKKFVKREGNRYIFGRFIREPRVQCIDHNNNNLGIIDTRQALALASEAGLDLVLISKGRDGAPSTCKILELSKFKYEQEKRDKLAKKKQRENAIKLKEVKFRPSTHENDLQIKATQLKEFLFEGNKIKATVVLRGREMAFKEIALEKMNKFLALISGKYEVEPSMTGRNLISIVIKKEDSN